MFEISQITIDGQKREIVTDEKNPVICIKAASEERNDGISKVQVTVTDEEGTVCWKWEEAGTESFPYITYQGNTLQPESLYRVQVILWNKTGQKAEKETEFRTGFLGRDWKAVWVTHPDFSFSKKENPPAFVFRKKIILHDNVKMARVFVTALGVYTLRINEHFIGKDVLSPGYTSYKNQIQYQVYDVTDDIKKSTEITATVAGGWAIATFGPFGTGQHAGKKQAFLMELHLTYEDGKKEIIVTDDTWEVSAEGPVREASIYDGEKIDGRIGAGQKKYEKSFVKCQILKESPAKNLYATYGMLPKRVKRMYPVKESKGKKGFIFDFGQNFSGVINIRIQGKEGQKVVIRHAEVLIDGELFTQPLRTAKARIEYICCEGWQEYTPRYTYMGFQYVEVEGLEREQFELSADVISSIEEIKGQFSCSNPDVTKLQENIKWGGLSNFVDIPTDCPQRDERLGWTGDIAVFAGTACFNFEMTRFLKKWLKDMRAEQGKHGGIPFVVPDEMKVKIVSAGWGDACVMVPYAVYKDSGDISVIKENYEMISRYLAQVGKMAHRFSIGNKKYIWDWGFSFGDWLTYNESQLAWMKKRGWVSTAYYANTCKMAAEMASAVGKEKDAEQYRKLRENIIKAYRKYYTDGKGRIEKEFQTAYACPLYFKMTEGKETEQYAGNLVRLIEENNNHLATGFLGTPYLLFALSDNGYVDKAYELLLQDTCPSWLYEVKAGVTTIWERWDALKPDGTVNLGEGPIKDISEQNTNLGGGMVSFNHYANGAVGDWLYRRCAGIEILEAGYKRFLVQPVPGGDITWVKCTKETPYGTISVNWKKEEKKFLLDVRVPFGTEAEIVLPDGTTYIAGSGEYHYEALSC